MSTPTSALDERKAMRKSIRQKTALPMLYLAMGSMVMLFGGLTSAYIVRKAEGNWGGFRLPAEFYFSTGILLLSSVAMSWAYQKGKQGQTQQSVYGLLSALVLGLGFVGFQFAGWRELVNQNIYFAGKSATAAGQYFYILTWMHFLHLAGGLITLLVTTVQAYKGKYGPEDYLGLKLANIFWHFLDLLWIYLLCFLAFAA
jgi:cytochrome c oxidase subunit 3